MAEPSQSTSLDPAKNALAAAAVVAVAVNTAVAVADATATKPVTRLFMAGFGWTGFRLFAFCFVPSAGLRNVAVSGRPVDPCTV
jgi:hypothetical protein